MSRKVVRVRDIMHQRFCRLGGLATIAEGLRAIRQAQGEAILVDKRSEDDEIGLVLLSDIAKKVMAKSRACERVSLYEIMAKPVVSVRPEMDVRYCARLFHSFGLNTAPVVDAAGEVVGLVSYRELVLDGLWPESEG